MPPDVSSQAASSHASAAAVFSPAATTRAGRDGVTPGGTAYTVAGHGEPLVLIHGVGMRRGIWAPQMAALARTHQVIVYDMLGHGESRLPPDAPQLSDYAAQLAELLAHLGIERANVAGHSMGALVALEFALVHSSPTLRVAALNAVYQRSAAQRAAVLSRAHALQGADSPANIAATLARWFGDPIPSDLQAYARLAGEYLATVDLQGYGRTYQLFAQADGEHVGRLASLTMPALFLTGDGDANSSPAMSTAMAHAVTDGERVVLANARHMMTLTHADEVNAILADWLSRPRA